ncbi:hypothetical protein M9H77_06553 [Catharanthus roseus]|uniref:Uncharacterized protein n=1 Tax=Catharanthus roseus TaxID=4058 RepID=A0ACC0BSM6_CATRO|nr:hypothetical protein M9H77_06553 [Catharanthus roseus]
MGETPTDSPGGQSRSDLAVLDPVKMGTYSLAEVLLDGAGITGLVSGMTSTSTGILLGAGTLGGLSEMSLSLRQSISSSLKITSLTDNNPHPWFTL